MTTLQQWLAIVGKIHGKDIDMGLERVKTVAEKMNLLHWGCPVILVGGTNGKGSTTSLLETIYVQAGYKTGCVTSPDLLRYNERIRVNGVEASDEIICEAFAAIETQRDAITITFFEFNVLAALYIFKQQPLDVLILEIGMGGRLDACNIIEPDLSIITTIALDHMDYLGDTREKIAVEKAGILRNNKPAVIGELNPPSTLLDYIRTHNLDAVFNKQDFNWIEHETDWQWQSNNTHYTQLPKPKILLQNASTVLAAIEKLQAKLPVTLDAIKQALKIIAIPGRFEIHNSFGKTIIFDVAHNPESCGALAYNLKKHYPNTRFSAVFSMLKGKDIMDSLNQLKPLISEWHIAALPHERGLDLSSLEEVFKKQDLKKYRCYSSIETAYESALKTSDNIVIFGSFVTVASIKRVI